MISGKEFRMWQQGKYECIRNEKVHAVYEEDCFIDLYFASHDTDRMQ